MQELKSQIMFLVYAGNLQDLDTAIMTARNVKEGLVIANKNK